MQRREFLVGAGIAAAAGGAVVLATSGREGPPEAQASAPASGSLPSRSPQTRRGAELLRMQEDLKRALAKPEAQRRWVMVVNTKKCTGCFACVVACMAENVAGPGVTYRTVPEVEVGDYPSVSRIFMPTNCQHCDNPPCLKAANAIAPGAVTKRPDGIVTFDYAKTRDPRMAEAIKKACPYSAVYIDEGKAWTAGTPAAQPYERAAAFEYGHRRERAAADGSAGAARKCHFCLHRLNAGMLPACITTCDGGVTYFGDLNDPRSLVSELVARHRTLQLRAQLGTAPRVLYLADDAGAAESLNTCLACHRSGF